MPNPKSNLDLGIHLKPAVYVLLLSGGRRYVGISLQLSHRLAAHWSGLGATATKLYKPIAVEKIVYPASCSVERAVTLQLMREAIVEHGPDGWQRVFGADWCKLFRRYPPRDLQLNTPRPAPTPRPPVAARADNPHRTAPREGSAPADADAGSARNFDDRI